MPDPDLNAVADELVALSELRTNYLRARWVITNSLFLSCGLLTVMAATHTWWLGVPAIGLAGLAVRITIDNDTSHHRGRQIDHDICEARRRYRALLQEGSA